MTTKNTPPALTKKERSDALKKAVNARIERAQLKDDIKRGAVTVAEVLDMDTEAAKRMRVTDLITSVPGYGEAKMQKLMDELGISMSRRVQGLGVRQRAALLERLGDE